MPKINKNLFSHFVINHWSLFRIIRLIRVISNSARLRLADVPFHIKRLFWFVVMFSLKYFLEALNSFFARHIGAGAAGKVFRYEHWLGQKSLDFSRAINN